MSDAAVRPKRQVYFVAGTDTDVGKTQICAALLAGATAQGHRCFGIKPITAGCQQDASGQWVSADAEQLNAAASVKLHPDFLAPIKLPLPVSPHLAAQDAGMTLNAQRIAGLVRGALSTPATHVLVEGAGGWRVPINSRESMADLAKALQLPVILVVGIRLGCINHAWLTAEVLMRDGLRLAGWVANIVDPNTALADAQIETLQQLLPAPCLGVVPFDSAATAESRAAFLQWPAEWLAAQGLAETQTDIAVETTKTLAP